MGPAPRRRADRDGIGQPLFGDGRHDGVRPDLRNTRMPWRRDPGDPRRGRPARRSGMDGSPSAAATWARATSTRPDPGPDPLPANSAPSTRPSRITAIRAMPRAGSSCAAISPAAAPGPNSLRAKPCQAMSARWIPAAAPFSSGWPETGSTFARTAASTRPAEAHCAVQRIGTKIAPRGVRSVTSARTVTRLSGAMTCTRSAGEIPAASASAGWISAKGSAVRRLGPGVLAVRVIMCRWSRTRPVSSRREKAFDSQRSGARGATGDIRARLVPVWNFLSAKSRARGPSCVTGHCTGASAS